MGKMVVLFLALFKQPATEKRQFFATNSLECLSDTHGA
jgi:hypothetical protein